MNSAGRKLIGFAVWAALSLAPFSVAAAQQPAANRVIGTVVSVSGSTVAVKTDTGATVNVTVPDTARIMQTAPGQKTLAGATKIAVGDMGAGDRVLMVLAGDPPAASIVVVNKASDIAAMQQKEQADWQRRGVGGLVKSVDATAGTVTIAQSTRIITITTTPTTVFRRYAPDSVKFTDAQLSTLAAIRPGDQVQARGDKSADGASVAAEEIVSGSFRNIAGTVVSTNAANGTFVVKDLMTKKTVTIRTTPDSDMRKIDPQIAQMIAMRLRAGGNGGNNGSAHGTGAAQAAGAAQGAGGNGQWRQGGGAAASGSGGGLARVLLRSPQIQIGDLHKDDAVMIVATSGNPDSATAIRLVAGVEPMLQASASGSQNMFSSAWSLGGGNSGDAGGGDSNQ
ncbi:MAG TPA: hypothetical protein VHX60_11720 [Acidobacteriaceae bacterium]|nr:hypothetical protein [Acidobacteriaceae bacterium]